MNDLHKAYNVLGLEPGTPMELVNRRYKRLIMVWHPDRFLTPAEKLDADEELKKINHAKDKLKQHFTARAHSINGNCPCKPGYQNSTSSSGTQNAHQKTANASTGPNPGAQWRQQEEELARKRNAERQRQAEEEAQRHAEAAAAAFRHQSYSQAVAEQDQQKYDSLRWKISAGCGLGFVILILVSLVAGQREREIISKQDASMPVYETSEQQNEQIEKWHQYNRDKQRIASELLGRPVSLAEITLWRHPYTDTNTQLAPIAQEINWKLSQVQPVCIVQTTNPNSAEVTLPSAGNQGSLGEQIDDILKSIKDNYPSGSPPDSNSLSHSNTANFASVEPSDLQKAVNNTCYY